MATRRRAALIAAALAVLAIAVITVVARPVPGDATLVRSQPTPTPSTDPNYGPTVLRVERTLASVRMPPAAIRLTASPLTDLDRPPEEPASDNLIDRVSFWSAPETADAAIAGFKADPPPGLTLAGWGEGNRVRFLAFRGSSMFRDTPWVLIALVGTGDAVAVRVDAMAIWTPTKPAWAFIGPVDSVDATVLRPNIGPGNPPPAAPTVRRTLTGAAAQRLADAIDALPMQVPGVISCPAERGFADHLTFHTRSGRTVDATVSADGCANVRLTVGGASATLSGTVDPLLLTELGLPAHYGW